MQLRSTEVRRARPLLGTFVEIAVNGLPVQAGNAAIDEAFAAIAEVQRRMSFHDPSSTLSKMNQRAAREPVRVDGWTFEVLQTALEMHRVSNGVFDVTIAPHLQKLGYLPEPTDSGVSTPTRTLSAAKQLRRDVCCMQRKQPCVSNLGAVELTPEHTVRFFHPEIKIDLGGIAKGFAVDQAIAALEAAGVPQAIVNAGGDMRVCGKEAFPIHVRHPKNPGDFLTTILLRNSALATSANYFAKRLVPGARVGPIIDPRSGANARRVLSASVRAHSAMIADALTKVVMLVGEDALPSLQHYHADAIFIAKGNVAMCSPRWNAPIDFSS